MAKFIEDRSSLKKKKKKETTVKKAAAPSSANKKQVSNIANQVVNRTANAAKRTTNTVGNSAQRQNTVRRNVQDTISRNAPQRYNNRPSGSAQPSTNHTVQDRLAASRQRREQAEADIKRRRQESEARSQRISQSRNPRMQDTQRGVKMQTEEERRQRQDRLRQAQEQKMGNNSMASKEAQRTANRAVRNTPTVVKESAKQVGIGHGKTFADITEANKSAAIGSKIDIKSKEFQEDIEKRRKESTRVAKSSFKTLSDMQEKSEQKLQDKTKDAKGLEKAYYGALESGVGMATDRLAGPAWAVSMLSRTYGNTRGQAQKEGATEDEDRAYSLLQAAKEVATEYMFQGVGLAKGLSGSKSLSLGETAANALTKNMRGPLANATHAGIRLLGGVGEENLEEVAGWGLDPFIKEFTYGRNVRTRQAQQMMREQSDALRSNITSMDDARAIAAYLGSDDFLDSQIRTYMDSGIGKEEARDLAENMRDYLDASLSGDTDRMADIEESLSKKLSGRSVKDIAKQDLSLSELKDTIASTTLLTATTGLPGTVTTTARGAAIKEQLGTDGIRALAKTAEDFEDGEMQLKAKAMSERLDAGKDITNTQAYDLAVGVQEQYNKDADRQQTAYQTAQKTIKSEKLVTPYRVSRDGDIQMDEVTDKTYQSTAKSAKSAIETFIENSDGKESLTDTEIDRGSRAIAGFKTGVFTVDDANELNFRNTAVRSAFEKETGIDLNEYVVKGKDGQIDIPATNTATKNALFAKAADNLVATAQAETANWVDNTKGEVVTQISRRMGASGTAALQTALDDVDERDRSSYMMTANASDVLYQSARNMGTEWENAKDYAKKMFPNVAEDKLKAMYEAGLADRDMATDEARGQQIKIGEKVELKKNNDAPTGQVLVETSAPVKGSVIRTFTELARNLGVDIHLVDHFTDKDGKVLKNVNGEYRDRTIFINVNSDFEKNMGFIFMHEVTHHLKMYAPEQYKALENLVREKWFKYDSAQMQSEIAKKIETYAKHGQTLTEEQALEEIIADAAHEFLTDRNFAREVANEDASLAQAVLTSIRNALRMLRRIMSADGLDETHMNTLFSQLDILDEAERLWLDAYKQAVRNNAAVAVDRLQNQIYEEGRQSISETSDADYMDAVNRGDMETARRMVEQKAAESGFANAVPEQTLSYKTRVGKPPQKTKKVYKVFTVDEQGRPSALFVSGVDPLPQNVWLDAQDTWHFKNTRNGKFYVPSTKNPNTEGGKTGGLVNRAEISDEDWNELVERGFVKEGSKSVTALAYRPGWHAGDIPFFPQGGTKVEGSNYENIHRFNQVVFECEMAFDVDYTKTHLNKQGQVAFEDMQEMPENGGYEFATNPMAHAEDIGKWFISSSLKIGRALTEEECNDILESHGRLPQEWQASEYKEKGKGKNKSTKLVGIEKTIGPLNLEALGYTGEQFDAARKTLAPVTYDDNGDVIPLSERFNEENTDIRFSISEPVERVKDLIAVHNLKADDIRNTFELGGFPMPSIAVTKDSMGHDEYGDITLMFHSDTIDPEFFRSNQVFGGDAWTPTFPSIAKKVSRQVADRVEQRLRDILGLGRNDYTLGDLRLPSLDDDNLTNALRYNEPYDAFKNDEVFQIAYLKDAKNFDVAIPTKEGRIRNLDKEALEYLDDRLPELTYDDIYNTVDRTMEFEPAVRQARKDYYESKGDIKLKSLAKHLDEEMGYSDVLSRLEATIKYREEGIPEVTDRDALKNKLNEEVDQEGFKAWIDNLFEGIIEKTGIRNNKDMFTPSGNRRSWESLHDPVTLENVVKVMKTELAAGGNGLFGSNPKGAAQKQYKSLDEIRDDEDRLQKLSEEEYKAQSEVAVGKMSEVCTSIAEHNPGRFSSSFGAALDVGSYVAEILNSTRNKATIKRKLTADYNLDVTDEQMNELMDAIDAIANLPTGYFEAKPRRAVGFDEVKAAIIPAFTDEDIKQGFSDRGIQMYEYDPDAEGDRTEKVNQAASENDLRFSISEDLDEPYMAAVNAGNMEEAQKYVEQAAERAGYKTRLYHGTRSFGFTQIRTTDLESKSDGGFFEWSPFFASDSLEVAQTYSSSEDIKRISEASEPFDEEQFENEYADAINDLVGAINGFAEVYNYMDYSVNPFASALKELQTTSHPADDIADDLIDNVSDIISELAWSRANDIVEANPDENRDVDDLADEIQEGPEANTIWVKLDIVTDMLRSYDAEVYGNASSGNYDLLTNTDNMMTVDAKGHRWNDIPFDAIPEKRGYYKTRQLAEIARDEGYAGIAISNLFDDGGQGKGKRQTKPATIYIFFNPERQVKSADTVTYAEDGSVIPLSERFDPTNNDIRYSMSTEDADGNVLTTNQMEYFKNSQARDEQGRLQVVYHTTDNGGFTVFDPWYSNDHRSLFFATNWNVSQTYGWAANKRFAENPANKHPTNYESFDDFMRDVNDLMGRYKYDSMAEFVESNKVQIRDADGVIAYNWGGKAIERFNTWLDKAEKGEDLKGNVLTMDSPRRHVNNQIKGKKIKASSYAELLSRLNEEMSVSRNEIPLQKKSSSKTTKQAGYYACYLNLENPLIVDAHGSNWNKIPYGEIAPNPIREQTLAKMESEAELTVNNISMEWDDFDDDFHFGDYSGDYRTLRFEISGSRRNGDGNLEPFNETVEFKADEDKFEAHADEYSNPSEMMQMELYEHWESLGLSYEYWEEVMNYADDMDGSVDYSPLLSNQEKAPDYITADGYKMDYAEIFDELNEESDEEYSYSPYEGVNVRTYRTRQLAELAESEGYDGVIIRNCRDVGGASYLKGQNPMSDILIALSANQVKDIRNENPTENPDIRYSITEDEGKSKKDYEHATDMSYEELLMYEDMIAKAPESYDIESAFGKAFDGEKVSKFYSALTEEVGMVFDDEILEEGRMRMAKSKADFWSNLNTKWQERWETKGEVLDTKSVKTNVRNLIRGVMNNSDTDRQYKTELVNKTLMDMRVAYQLMKQDRTDIASALLYHSALRMITDVDFIQDDTEYQEYKGIRDYLRGEPITVGEDYWQSKAFQQFRKEHYGILKLRKGANGNIGEVYAQLENLYPHIFSEAERSKNGFKDDEEDLLQYIGFVTEQNMQPFMEAYSSEYCADWAFEIADDLYEIMENGEGVTSLADRYKEKYDAKAKAMKTRHAEAILRVRKQKDAAIDALKNRYNERLDRQKELAKDAIRREREKFRQQKQAEKERTKERRLHSKYFDSIVKSHKKLSDRLLTNTKDKHIPEQYKKDLAELLAAFDLQTVASKKLEIRNGLYYRQNYQSQKTIRMKALQETLLNIQADSQLFYVNDSITEIIDRLLGKNAEGKTDPLKSVEGRTIDELTSSELKDIDKLLKALIHEFNYYESVRVGTKRQQAADIGTAQIDSCLDHAGKFGEGLDYQNFLGALDNIIGLDEVTPAYMFRQIDPQNNGIGLMFKELRRSFGKYVRNQNQLNEWMEEIIGEYHNKGKLWNKYGAETLEDWRRSTSAKEFQLTNGTVKLTPAQMMSIYCLSNRQQAYDHMTGAGIVVQPVSFQARMASDLKKKANYALPVILTDSDINLIKSKLTPDQTKVADKLQKLMATKMAEWGNEASMSVMGIRLFEDPDYFPIKSDKAALEKDFSAEQFMDCIRNFGFTKAVQPGARNAIAIGDIFDVVAEHCNNMNLYNAYSEAMNDFMKVYNFHAMREDGSDYSVEQAIAHAYSKKATTFISTFMKDLNGNVSRERATGIEQMLNDSLGKAKKASVFANGRVALQQPTALMRAFAVISPKYLKGVKAGKATMQEMFEHSPIALWKSWGYYDINMGKSIEDLMMNNGSWAEDKMSDIYGELDNRTWAVIWTMCKNEIEDKHKDVEKGSDEYWELVSERFDEVVDLTQVVDSPFHRSHAMRSKNTFVKMATAFMAEPTLTFNMVRDGFIRAKEEYRLGNKGKARKILGRTVTVFVLSAWATSAAAAIWDAVRGKSAGDDDDDDQSFFEMWYDNMIENFKDNVNLLNDIYWVKELVSLSQGWDQRNLGLQGWKHLADMKRQLCGDKVSSNLTWYENLLAGVGYLSGVPLKTMMNDGKAIFKMFGLSAPGFITDQLDKLDSIGSSTKDMNRGASSSTGISDPKTSSKSTAVNLWTYDNAPFRIEDGSAADNFLNHFGINLTSAEIAAAEEKKIKAEREKKVEDIKAKTAGMSGVEKDKKVWSYISSQIKKEHGDMPVSSIVEAGDYNSIYEYREMYVAAGGNTDYFDERIFDASKKAMKKSIVYNPTDAQIEAQNNIRNYLTDHGMSESELSEIAYKSYTAKELKVAFRLNDEDAIVEELTPLVRAGLSLEDFHRIYDNRNRIDLKKYKESGGKYAEKLKSMGDYNWPCNGTITSTFGHRSSPGGIGSTNHQGIDIGASMGAPVTAADGGVVVRSGWYGGYGKTVQIQHDDGTITQYSHLSWWEPKVGDVVAQGQEIGKVGSTGNSTGPHLHFGVIKNGNYVDPMDYLNKKS